MSSLEVILLSSILLRWPSAPGLGSGLSSDSTWSRLPSISSQEEADLVLLKAHKKALQKTKLRCLQIYKEKGIWKICRRSWAMVSSKFKLNWSSYPLH